MSSIREDLNQGVIPIGVPSAYKYDNALIESALAQVNQGLSNVNAASTNAVNSIESLKTQGEASIQSATNSGVNLINSTSSSQTDSINTLGNTIIAQIEHGYGYPFTASTASAMTDTTKIYVYIGSETGYTAGNWYYYDGTDWVSGGVYNATALETDKTLTVSGAAADAKIVGDDVNTLNALSGYDDRINSKLSSYDGSFCKRPYSTQIVRKIRAAAIMSSKDVYHDDSPTSVPRAICYIPVDVTGKVYIYNNNTTNFRVGVIKRNMSDFSYVGYVINFNARVCNNFTPDINYYYGIVVANLTDTNFSVGDIEKINNAICIYTGDYLGDDAILQTTKNTNLITPNIIHIGKYYYGNTSLADNATMAYTDLIPIKEYKTYYFPFLTLGYSWYNAEQECIGGNYTARENDGNPTSYLTLRAPAGAAYIGISVRSGDVPNMVLSEIPNSKATVEKASTFPVLKSKIVREPLNWIYNTDYKQNSSGSRLSAASSNGGAAVYSGEYLSLTGRSQIYSHDVITMDKSKISSIFALPSGATPEFELGYNGYYASGSSLSIADGGLAILFKADGVNAEIRRGDGQAGGYATLLKTVDISSLNIHSGAKFYVSIEKDSVNKQVITIYNALSPTTVITETIEATPTSDENLYTGQTRCWGGVYFQCKSGTVNVYNIQMYSTAPTYPKIAVWGDSYVENMGRNPACGYAYLLKQELNGNVFLSGMGGATSTQLLQRFPVEINTCAPQYIIFNIGVNDSFNVTITTFKDNINALIAKAKAVNAEPILITIPKINTGTLDNTAWIQEANSWIRSLGYRYIDIALALSTGTETSQDLTKYVDDKTHPNLLGGQAIFNYIKAFLPDLLW